MAARVTPTTQIPINREPIPEPVVQEFDPETATIASKHVATELTVPLWVCLVCFFYFIIFLSENISLKFVLTLPYLTFMVIGKKGHSAW